MTESLDIFVLEGFIICAMLVDSEELKQVTLYDPLYTDPLDLKV